MARLRKIKKFGNSYGIHLTPADLEDYSLIQGDIIDISEMVKISKINVKGEKLK